MIEILKSCESFILKADIQGVEEILGYIQTISEKNEKYILVLHLGKEKKLIIKAAYNNEMFMNGNAIEIYMDKEEVEYFEDRLKESLISKYFYPAEISEYKYKNKYVTIYLDIVS